MALSPLLLAELLMLALHMCQLKVKVYQKGLTIHEESSDYLNYCAAVHFTSISIITNIFELVYNHHP